MTRISTALIVALAAGALLFIASCGKDEGGTGPDDVARPTVASTDPADGSTDVSLLAPVAFTFSEPMDPTSISETTLLVTGRPSGYHVRYDLPSRTAIVTPDTLHAAEAWYRAVVTEGAVDLNGNPAVPETIGFQTGPLDCEHLADGNEPNDNTAEATPVGIDREYYSLSVCGEDNDTYQFSLSEATKVTFGTYIKHAPPDSAGHGPDWHINFLRADGEDYATLGTGAPQAETRSFYHSFLPGTYYCEVYSNHGLEADDYVLYDVSLIGTEPCQDDAYEDNDFPDEATQMAEGIHSDLSGCYTDADYFTMEMAAGETLTVTVDATVPEGAWAHRRLTISPPTGGSFSYDGEDNPTVGQLTATASGPFTILVMFWVDGVTYTLDLEKSD
jgi:hypothetical protein